MTILVLIFGTIIRVGFFPESNVACQITHLIYRCLEIGVVVLLGYPLRTYKAEKDSGGSSPSYGKPSIELKVKTMESEEKFETKSEESSATSSESDTD